MANTPSGVVVIKFKSGGIAEFQGMAFPFEIKGKAITVKENGRDEVFIVKDDGSLQVSRPGKPIIFIIK
ncbi:MAG: hypothetical protein V2B20_10395 [Pseudomonadota bacterium]